jgi:hypothetical protein
LGLNVDAQCDNALPNAITNFPDLLNELKLFDIRKTI